MSVEEKPSARYSEAAEDSVSYHVCINARIIKRAAGQVLPAAAAGSRANLQCGMVGDDESNVSKNELQNK